MSANLLDSFFIALGFDTTGLVDGQKKAADSLKKTGDAATKTQKDVDEGAKRMAEGYKKLLDSVMAVTAAIVGMVAGKDVVEHLTKQDAALARSSKFMNVSTQDLQNWQGAAIQTGDTADGMQDAFQHVSSEMQKMALTGKSDMIPFLVQAHVDLGKFFSAATPLPEKLKLIQDAMKGMDPARAKALLEGMGLGGAENSLTTQRAAFEKFLEVQERLNAHTKEDDAAAIRRAQAWQLVEAALEGVGRQITTFVSPAIEGLLNFISAHAPAAASLILGVGAALSALSAIRFGGLISGLAQLGGAFAGAAGSAGTLLAFMGRLGLVGAAGAAGFALGTFIEDETGIGSKFGSWLSDKINGNGPSMAGGYVPGTVRGLGQGGAGGDPLGIRNNNPGNLNFAGQTGASRAGRFAAFGSMAEGIAALDDQLHKYASRGNDTVRGIIGTYAPPGENDTGSYIAEVAKKLGVSPDLHLNLNDPEMLRGLMGAITTREVGSGRINIDQINAGMALSMSRSGGGGGTHVTIDQVHVHTTAATMSGTGQDLGNSLRRHIAVQSNTGLL
jgi:hypothetical protein